MIIECEYSGRDHARLAGFLVYEPGVGKGVVDAFV